MIESSVKALVDRDDACSPSVTLVELFELVNSKLTVNLAVLEVILYSAMVVSIEEGNYKLPKTWTDKGLGVAGMTIPNRSLSAAMAYEDHRKTICSPKSFFIEGRTSHPMDVFLTPAEVMANIKLQ